MGIVTAADFVGDYALYLVGTALDGDDVGPVEVASYVIAATATLAADFHRFHYRVRERAVHHASRLPA